MTNLVLTYTIEKEQCLREFLLENNISRKTLTRIKFDNDGSIKVNDKEENVRYILKNGDKVTITLPSEKFNYGDLVNSVSEAEVILSNGDIINIGKISRKELSEKIALSNFEGEIYRKIDTLIEDNYSLIQQIDSDSSFGYSGIANVKSEDGTFNLIPLFFGSLGTLGIITEAKIQTN